MDAGRTVGRLGALIGRARALIADRSDTAVAQKMAGSAFLIRVVNAGIAFASQILLARWMGQGEYGVYVYVWTWVLLLGGVTSLGLASAPQRFIPEYADNGDQPLLRGFLLGSRALSTAISTAIAAVGLLGIYLFQAHLDSWAVAPLYLALVCVPMYVLTDVQDGIARTYNWIDVALAPAYFVRPLLILALLGLLAAFHFTPNATTAMAATVAATWVTTVAQTLMLGRRLKTKVAAGPRTFATQTWMKVSLPIFMVEGFYLLLAYTDVLVLSAFNSPHDVAVYYAAVKVMSLVAFVSFSVSAAVAHRFTEYSVAGDHERLSAMVRDAARWTFWPSLAGCAALLAVGWPMLWMFGSDFTEGYPMLFVIAIGLLARAMVGPLERLLNMLGQQNLCAAVYGSAFALNVALCFALVPPYSAMGAAIATSITLAVESVILYWVTRKRLGLGALPWSRSPASPPVLRESLGDAVTDAVVSPLPIGEEIEAPAPEAPGELRFELAEIDALKDRRAAWDDLAARALEQNPFAEADFAFAASNLKGARGVKIATVWDGARMLVAAPVSQHRAGLFASGYASAHWGHFGPLGTPLVDRDRADDAVAALLDGLSASGRSAMLFRFLPEAGPVAEAIRATGREIKRVEGHERAVLSADVSAEAHLEAFVSPKRLKEYRRQLRRLGDDRPVTFREAKAPATVKAALVRYLAVEADGWKGEGGSAMRAHPDQAAFVDELATALAGRGRIRILELMVGDEVAASGVALVSGSRAWFYKVAYDERFAKCSPGVQLTLELTRRLIADPQICSADSTAIADHPMIDRLWGDRLALGDWLVPLSPSAGRLLTLSVRIERRLRSARETARALIRRIKDQPR